MLASQTVDKPINGDNVQTFKLLMSKNIYLQNRDMNSFFARLIKLFRNSKTSCRTEKRLFRQAETSAHAGVFFAVDAAKVWYNRAYGSVVMGVGFCK